MFAIIVLDFILLANSIAKQGPFNTDISNLEIYTGSEWNEICTGSKIYNQARTGYIELIVN